MQFKGRQRSRIKNSNGEWQDWSEWRPNLFVDDGVELTLDFLFGRKSWWNPLDRSEYTSSNIGWNIDRYIRAGVCMFSNSSPERGDGQNGIPVGDEYSYQVSNTMLVAPEDSFLSRATGEMVSVICNRIDQTVQFTVHFNSPGDIPTGTYIRELGVFLSSTYPTKDPSYDDANKPRTMICRSVYAGSGYYNSEGATGEQGTPGFALCYKDEPLYVTNDINIEWEFGEF
jgi:hypothetical protein